MWHSWPTELRSPLSVEAAEAALRTAVARRATWFVEDPTGRLGPRVVFGRVDEDGEIRLTASSSPGPSSWRRTLRARLVAVPDGSVVTGVLLPNVLGTGFMIILLTVAGLLAAGGTAAAVRDAALHDWSALPSTFGVIGTAAGMALWGLLMTALGNRYARHDEEFPRAWLANLLTLAVARSGDSDAA